MRPTGQLVVEELLAPAVVARWVLGVVAALGFALAAGVVAWTAVAAAILARAVEPAGAVRLLAAIAAGAVAYCCARLVPRRRRFVLDRTGLVLIVGRKTARCSLVGVGAEYGKPPQLIVHGRRYPISERDYDRVMGLLHVNAPLRSRKTQPVAAVKLTIFDTPRPRRKPVARHPTLI